MLSSCSVDNEADLLEIEELISSPFAVGGAWCCCCCGGAGCFFLFELESRFFLCEGRLEALEETEKRN